MHLLEEAEALRHLDGRIGKGNLFLQIPGGADEMAPTGLPVPGFGGVVGGAGIADQGAAELLSQQQHGALCGAVGGDLEEGQVLMSAVPDEVALAILAPTGLIGMHHRRTLQLHAQLLIQPPALVGRLAVKVHRRGGNQRHAKEVLEDVLRLAIGDLQVVAQMDGHRPRQRPALAAGQFIGGRLIDRPPALAAPALFMHIARHPRLGNQDDILLHVLIDLGALLQIVILTMRALPRGGHMNLAVDPPRLRPAPGPMAERRPTLAGRLRLLLGRRLGHSGLEVFAVLQRQAGDGGITLSQRLGQLINLALIVRLHPPQTFAQFKGLLIVLQHPGAGHALQVGAGVTMRTIPVRGRFLASAHVTLAPIAG